MKNYQYTYANNFIPNEKIEDIQPVSFKSISYVGDSILLCHPFREGSNTARRRVIGSAGIDLALEEGRDYDTFLHSLIRL